MKVTYWICSYKGNGDGSSSYTPIIQFPNREEAYKAIEKVNQRKYTVLPQVED
jgi:hypothetical protein